jgi:hypothetical protein
MQPLPGGMLPPDQTIEGGAQVRVTPAGFNKLTMVVPGVINDLIADLDASGDLCIPRNNVVDAGIAEATICAGNNGNCTNGCPIGVNIDRVDMSVPNNGTFNIAVQLDANVPVKVDYEIFWVVSGSCTATVTANNAVIDIDIGFGIDPADGEMTLQLDQINTLNLTGVNVNGCGLIGDIVDAAIGLVSGLLNSFLGDLLLDLLTPMIDSFLQGMLPDPLGIEGVMDVGALTGTVSPGTNASMEIRGVPGGYVQLVNGGMSLGLITGINSDEDPTTRDTALDSEPALCVPPFAAPDFSAPPASLPTVFRSAFNGNTFALAPADAFLGSPDPAAEIAIGLSETTLDLAGHHAVASGMMCMGLGTSLIEQLNLGTIGILVPSLAALGNPDGTDPLLLVTRPQKPLDFSIGEGTMTDPALNIHIQNFEIDFYAFIFDRFVRGFTLEVSMDVGVNLEATTDDMGNPAILPMLTGLATEDITIKVHNSEFLLEDQQTLEDVLPAIFDLAVPLITDGLGPITLPEFAGFTLENIQVAKVTTSEDDFLAIYASLGTAAAFQKLGQKYPSVLDLAAKMPQPTPAMRAVTRASLRSVFTPQPAVIRKGLGYRPGGDLPEVVIDVESHDELGRELEWTWNINGGMWRPFTSVNPLVIRDRAFAWQGKYTVGLKSRVKGDYRTLDTKTVEFPVTIDSVGPRIIVSKTQLKDGKLLVPVHDLVSKDKVTVAFGHIDDNKPATKWKQWDAFSADEVRHLVNSAQHLKVWARDELGNTSTADLDVGPIVGFHGSGGAGSGCECSAGDSASLGGLGVVFGFTVFMLFGVVLRRRKVTAVAIARSAARGAVKAAPFAAVIIGMSVLPACSCGSDPGDAPACMVNEDCIDFCPEGTVPLCFEDACLCADDVPYGRIGRHSDMAISSSGAAWVSAYNETHGDLMVARFETTGRIPLSDFEFVDGVPDGPVVLPESNIRGGIFDAGPDVGQYTSIAVGPNDEVMVAYFDVDNNQLKFAVNNGGVWTSHVVDDGTQTTDPELGFEIAGKWTSITLSSDGRPGIAYFAKVSEGGGNVRTEVRYASAQTATPTGTADWSLWIADTMAVDTMAEAADVFPVPLGTGLFVDSARLSDDTPVIVYYDRVNGDLKLARFDGVAGTFMTPETIDGNDMANQDVGWYPSVAVDSSDELHITYVNATRDDLYYYNTIDSTPEVVDDGYRIVGTTEDGLPKPEFHFVGDDSSVVLTNAGPVIAYQDSTTHELLIANKNGSGAWEHHTVAGDEEPFEGGYGFYAASDFDGQQVILSNFVVSQPTNEVWVEIFRENIVVE